MIKYADVLLLHDLSIRLHGGARGVRDMTLLSSAICRPFQTFDGNELYQSPFEKAAAAAESIIINHPFIDGNKRTGMLVMIAMLYEYGIELSADGDTLFEFIISISTGELKYSGIVSWLEKYSVQIE